MTWPHRDGSFVGISFLIPATGCQTRGGAKQLYGVCQRHTSDSRLSPPGGDAPETSPFRRLGHSKRQARPPRGDSPHREPAEESSEFVGHSPTTDPEIIVGWGWPDDLITAVGIVEHLQLGDSPIEHLQWMCNIRCALWIQESICGIEEIGLLRLVQFLGSRRVVLAFRQNLKLD
jgi:hypothetical protein